MAIPRYMNVVSLYAPPTGGPVFIFLSDPTAVRRWRRVSGLPSSCGTIDKSARATRMQKRAQPGIQQ